MIFPGFLSRYLAELIARQEACLDWDPEPPHSIDINEAEIDRRVVRRLSTPVRDLEDVAAQVRYKGGKHKIKRTRYRPVDLSSRRVVIGLHQAGAERGEQSTAARAKHSTCHRLVGPTGVRYRIHPLQTRLMAANALDRKPFHAINIEVQGNFAGVAGNENTYYRPDVFGRGVLGAAQCMGVRDAIAVIHREVKQFGGAVEAIAPHRVSGRGYNKRTKKWKPNRELCCGSEVWSQCGEWAAVQFGLLVPSPFKTFGGLTIPHEWHGEYYDEIINAGLEQM